MNHGDVVMIAWAVILALFIVALAMAAGGMFGPPPPPGSGRDR